MPYAPSTKNLSKAWVNFNTDSSINASFNVQSVLKNSTGNYTIVFIFPMNDVDYTISVVPSDDTNNLIVAKTQSQDLESFTIQLYGGRAVILGISVMTTQPIDPNIGVLVTVNGD